MVDSCLLSQLERFCYHFSPGLQFQNKNPKSFELVFTYSQCTFLSVFFLQLFVMGLQNFNYSVFQNECFWIYMIWNSLSFLDVCLVPDFESLLSGFFEYAIISLCFHLLFWHSNYMNIGFFLLIHMYLRPWSFWFFQSVLLLLRLVTATLFSKSLLILSFVISIVVLSLPLTTF